MLIGFLADHTFTLYDQLLASYCPSVYDAVHYGTQGRCRGWKLYHCAHRMALPIHFLFLFLFFRLFCCGMYHLATVAVARTIQHSATTQRNMVISDAAFSLIRFCSLLSDSYTSALLIF